MLFTEVAETHKKKREYEYFSFNYIKFYVHFSILKLNKKYTDGMNLKLISLTFKHEHGDFVNLLQLRKNMETDISYNTRVEKPSVNSLLV